MVALFLSGTALSADLPSVQIVATGGPLPADVRAFWHHTCSEASMIERVRSDADFAHIALADGTGIWRLPCRSGAYAMQHQVFFRYGGNLQSISEAYRFNGIEPKTLLLQAPEFLQAEAHSGRWSPVWREGLLPLPNRPLPLFLEEKAADGRACRTWAWLGAWFERIDTECGR